MNLLEKIKFNYDSGNRVMILHSYNEMIKLLEEKNLIIEPVDRYVLLFVFNAGYIIDLSNKEAIINGVKLYDAFDPLNRFDTAAELFLELWLLEPNDC